MVTFLAICLALALITLTGAAAAATSFCLKRDRQPFRPAPRPRLRRGHRWY